MLRIIFLLFSIISFFQSTTAFAKGDNFVSIVNPVRGYDFWDQKNQKIEDAVIGEAQILKQFNLNATWLIRFDALEEQKIINEIKTKDTDEKGLFLEVTPSLTKEANVEYHTSGSWHSAASAFLAGYETFQREKLIDTAFEKFKKTFGFYPKSVGAWWIDSYSLDYMYAKYGISGGLIVADQYTTDNYQIWGQYFSTPYYPSKNNALHPAQNLANKLPVVITQWAARDPINSYGNGVFESTFSVQANDYLDYHNLDTGYFSKLLDIYTKSSFNRFSHLVIGLENSYFWEKYKDEYQNQIKTLADRKNLGQISIIPLKDFSNWYSLNFPDFSPEQIIVADDPLGSFKKAVWFMNPYYRAGWFYNKDGSVFRDIRQYVGGEEELCFKKRCDSINFATSAIRVLDEVSFGHKWVIDEGKINDFKIIKNGEKLLLSYKNETGKARTIEFLPRDIGIDGKISSIDTTILEATKQDLEKQKIKQDQAQGNFQWSALSGIWKAIKFLLFLAFACLIPGYIILGSKNNRLFFFQKIFLSIVVGMVCLTILFYIASLLKIGWLVYVYLLINILAFLKFHLFKLKQINLPKPKNILDWMNLSVIAAGTVFQVIPTFRSGLVFPFGMGFWGPNTHDGVWHVALINQLIKSIPPQNPIFSSSILKNYHFFYDILVACAHILTNIPILDLVFRFFPVIFSLSLGIGSYFLVISLFKDRLAAFFSLYLIYFAGSFGWIVEFIKERHIGGESAFWANQSVSFNLNPPFAISLIIIIALFQIRRSFLISAMLTGALIVFKAYAALLMLMSLLIVGIIELFKNRSFYYLIVFVLAGLISIFLFWSNFQIGQTLLVLSPFWFIHSMVDSPDRVGWDRLSLAREVGLSKKQWFKYFTAEIVSLLIFLIGNLGLRFFSLGILVKIRKIIADSNLLFIFIFAFFSMLIPILFIQSGNPWNTIQFFYYFIYISALVSGIVITQILKKIPKIFAFLIIAAILIISPINSVVTASSYLSYLPHAKVSLNEIESLNFLSKQKEGIVLTYPYDSRLKTKMEEPWPLFIYDSTAYVSALSNKAVYLEDLSQNQILLTDYKKRQVASNDFFMGPDSQKIAFLKKNNIRYIYIPKIFKVGLDESIKEISKIFENKEVVIYKLNVD